MTDALRPVFIGGCPRSGTTMLGAMLGAHPRCVTPIETLFKGRLVRAFPTHHTWNSADAVAQAAGSTRNLDAWLPKIEHVLRVNGPLPSAILLEKVVRAWADAHESGDADTWIDHTPENITMVRALEDHWPKASFIHLVRDGRAVAASSARLSWGPATVLGAAGWWTRYVANGLAVESTLRERVLRVRYEDLVLDTQRTLRRLCEFLGLEYVSAMATGSGFSPTHQARRRSRNQLVGRPPISSRVTAWQSQLDDREVEIFEALTGELLSQLGYEPRFADPRRASCLEILRLGVRELCAHARQAVGTSSAGRLA